MNIDQFLEQLDRSQSPLSATALQRLMARLRMSREDVLDATHFSDRAYQRNVLRATPEYAALVLCWKPGQRSPIHDHRGVVCGVRVIEGTATEIKYERAPDGLLSETATASLPTGGVCASIDSDIHVVANNTDANLITLHVYTPPMTAFSIYNLEDATMFDRPDTEVARFLAGV